MRTLSISGIIFILLFSMHQQIYANEIPAITIQMDEAGTLPSKIPADKKDLITDLTITGPINGTDIRFIREMIGKDKEDHNTSGKLTRLNLSNARIVEGGNYYVVFGLNFGDGEYYETSDDVIGGYMFYYCKQLTELILPESIKAIAPHAFESCTGLKSIIIPPGVKKIQKAVFTRCSNMTTISLPQNLEELGESAFSYCNSLTSISIPGGIKILKKETFSGCNSLESISIPDNIITLETSVFNDCSALRTIEIGNNVTTIEPANQFCGLENLTQFIVKGGNTSYCSIDGVLFSKDKKTLITYPAAHSTEYTIPNSVTTIAETAFLNSSKLKSVTIPNSVENIQNQAFMECSGLVTLNIPDHVKTIGDYTFSGCTNLTSVNVPNSVSDLGEGAFRICSELASVTFGSSISSLKEYLFRNCAKLAALIIPQNIKTISNSAFSGCLGLQEIHCLSSVPPVVNEYFYLIPQNIKLYVPKGSYPSYWLARGWEKMDIVEEEQGDYDIHFRVSVSTNRGGTILIGDQTVSSANIKKGEAVSIKIVPDKEHEIDRVILNGKDITAEIKNQTYTLSSINEDLAFNIMFRELPVYLFFQHADNGQIKQIVQKGDSYSYQIIPAENWRIHSITFNGNIVTDELTEDNIFTTPSISENSYLNVTFENTGGTAHIPAYSDMKVYSAYGKLIIENLHINDKISIYNESGILIKKFSAIREKEEIKLPAHQIYMIKGNGKAIKVIL